MSWWSYVEGVARTARQRDIAERTGIDATNVTRWKSGQIPKPAFVAAFARAYDRPVLEAFVAAGFLTVEEADAQVVIESDPLDEYDDLELLDELRARYIERVTTDAKREDGGGHVRSASNTQPSPAGDDAGQQGNVEQLFPKYPPETEWADDVQTELEGPPSDGDAALGAGNAEWRGPASNARKHPSRREWMDEQAKAARRGKADQPPDTTTGEESQLPDEDRDPRGKSN